MQCGCVPSPARLLLAACLAVVLGCTQQPPPRAESSLARAAAWLWQQQADDGGWHSNRYGLLKSGQAYTPFILHALLAVPEDVCPRPHGGVARALEFIRRNINAAGVLGLADPDVPEYPNYATAYAILCLAAAGREQDWPLVEKMRRYLADQQFREQSGFAPGHVAHGGWGFGPERPAGSTGHMDLAHTRHVLDALRRAGHEDAATYEQAQVFLRLMQRQPSERDRQPSIGPTSTGPIPFDGGFYFSPVVLAANKAGEADHQGRAYFRSYASATCDGLLALLAAGVPRGDERVASAVQWLEAHPRLDYPEGVPQDQHEPWGESIRYYHAAVRGEIYARLNWPGSWREDLARLLISWQQADGSFTNPDGHLMKEDDPLLATTYAVIALTVSREDAKSVN